MIKFENNNITAITYNGYDIVKVYGECSDSPVWEKQQPTPPTPTGIKWQYTNLSGVTRQFDCDTSSTLTNIDVLMALPDDERTSGITSVVIGECVTVLEDNVLNAAFSLSSVTLHNGITAIGHDAFHTTDIRSLTIPTATTVISDALCINCYQLSSVTIHSGVTSIGIDSFGSCRSLLDITIPASVTSIGEDAFNLELSTDTAYARANRRVTVLATTPPTIGQRTFNYVDIATYPIYVPAESLQAYKTAPNWSSIAERIYPIT